ncbi:MAG: glycosyl hydrolase family 28-related protein [Candidatus Krumholzibacteriia bacterium]
MLKFINLDIGGGRMLRYHTGISRDANYNVLAQAHVHAYLPGTQTYVATFSDELGAVPVQQPLTSDAQGNYSFYTPEPIVDLRYVTALTPALNLYDVPIQARQTPFVVSVESFGAKGDGVTDDRTAIQAAVDAATGIGPGSTVRFRPGRTYRILGEVLVQETLTLDLSGAVIEHTATASVGGLFRFRAPQQFAITWPTDVEAGTREWLEQDPPYSQGDYLLFTTDYDWIDRQYKYGNTHYGQAFLVERVDGGTVTVSDAFIQGMKASDGIQLRSFKRISPVIRGGEIRTDDSQAGGGLPGVSYCIRFCHCVQPRIEGTRLNGLEYQYSAYVRFEHCFGPVADGVVLSSVNLPRGSTDGVYGVHFAGATSHGQLLNSDSHGLRHFSDVTWADLENDDGDVLLSRVCGVFWSLTRCCRAFDSVNSGFGPHGAGRYFDFVDCQAINGSGAGFSTRVSYTRYLNCRAESPGVESYAFDFGGGIQLPTDDQGQPSGDGETLAFGGQNPLVGCEMVNCTQEGYQKGLFRVCNMSSLIVRDCNLELPNRLDDDVPYYWFFGHFDYSNPRRWQSGWRYLPGDWVRDAWQVGEVWHYGIYECVDTQEGPSFDPPHTASGSLWTPIDGDVGHPSPIRGQLVIRNCRFIHQGSGWYYSGLHPDFGFKGPFVFPVLVELDGVESSPAWRDGYFGLFLWSFRVILAALKIRLFDSSMSYALCLKLPGEGVFPPMMISGEVVPAEVRIFNCELEGDDGSWSISAGGSGEYTLSGSNLDESGAHRLLGPLEVSGDASIDGSIVSQARVKAGAGLALGNAQDVPSGFPGDSQKIMMVYDMEGNELGYLLTYSLPS